MLESCRVEIIQEFRSLGRKYQSSIPEIIVVRAVHELAKLLKAGLKRVYVLRGDVVKVNF